MGALLSGLGHGRRIFQEEVMRSRQIDSAQEKNQLVAMNTVKLLLLGAGESGKSTLFKQMISLYGHGWPKGDRIKYVEAIHNNCITSMQTLCQWADKLGATAEWTSEQHLLKEKVLEYVPGSSKVDQQLLEVWSVLGNDPAIQRTLAQRSKFQLLDSAEYYFGRLGDIVDTEYVPLEGDVMRTRIKTTGIIETEFVINETRFAMFDVGGQRSERKKWMHCFEDVTAVLFVAAMNEFDQSCEEDEDTNRLDEAVDLFHQICNDKWLSSTAMILFLNKSDLLLKKLETTSFKDYDEEYEGDNSFEQVAQRLEQMFKEQNLNPKRPIYAHVTCATNPENVKHVFNSVKDIILTRSLQNGGLDV